MATSAICICFMVLSISVRPSEELPGLLKSATDSLFKTPLAKLKNEIALPTISKLGGENIIGQTISSIVAVTSALQGGDFLLVAIKLIELTRKILKTIPIPGASEMESLLEMIHGVLETIHPFLAKLRNSAQEVKSEEIANGNGEMFTAISDVTPASVFTNGLQFLTNLPKLLMGQ